MRWLGGVRVMTEIGYMTRVSDQSMTENASMSDSLLRL